MPLNSPMRRMFGIPGHVAQPVSVGAPAMAGAPPGNGVLIRSLERHVGTPDQLVDTARAAGLTWVAILTLWQYDTPPPPQAQAQVVETPGAPPFAQKPLNQEIAPYAVALGQAGIQPWLWGHPLARPDAVKIFVDVVGALAGQTGAAGILVEPRQSWGPHQGVETSGANLIAQLRQQSGGRPVGVMSYANTQEHPLPWDVFAQTADFGAPWGGGDVDPTVAAQGYTQHGFRAVVPVVGADQNAPPAPSRLWWDWFEISKHQRWAKIRETMPR